MLQTPLTWNNNKNIQITYCFKTRRIFYIRPVTKTKSATEYNNHNNNKHGNTALLQKDTVSFFKQEKACVPIKQK